MTITSRLYRLTAQLSKKDRPPTYEEFCKMWQSTDPLSKSLFELSLSSPELIGKPKYYDKISEYLRRPGVQVPEPIDENFIKTLKSDD